MTSWSFTRRGVVRSGSAQRRLLGDDRGSVGVETIVWLWFIVVIALALVALVRAKTVALRNHRPLDWGDLARSELVVLVIGVGVPLLLWAVVFLVFWCEERRVERWRAGFGAATAASLGLADSTAVRDEELRAWRRAVRSGLTDEVVQRWSARSVPFVVAAAIAQAHVDEDRAVALLDAVRSCGLWDGRDRRALVDVLGDLSPHQYLRFDPERVLEIGRRMVAMTVEAHGCQGTSQLRPYLRVQVGRAVFAAVALDDDLTRERTRLASQVPQGF